MPALNTEHTYCPQCQTKCIERNKYIIDRFDKKDQCPACGNRLNITDNYRI